MTKGYPNYKFGTYVIHKDQSLYLIKLIKKE